jgi:hypothetical protein
MKTLLLLCFLALLTGCTSTGPQLPVVTQIENKVNADLQRDLTPDFTNALAQARTAGYTNHAECWAGLIAVVSGLPTATPGGTVPANMIGLASGAELLAELNDTPPTLPTFIKLTPAVHDACAGILISDQEVLAKFGIGLGLLKTPGAVATLKATALAPKP